MNISNIKVTLSISKRFEENLKRFTGKEKVE